MLMLCYPCRLFYRFMASGSRRRRLRETDDGDPGVENLNLPNDDVSAVVRERWNSISTWREVGRLRGVFNIRVVGRTLQDVREDMTSMRREVTRACKIQYSVGFVTRNDQTGRYAYYHPSQNKGVILARPLLCSSNADLARFLDNIDITALIDVLRRLRPNTKVTVVCITNIQFYLYFIAIPLIGCFVDIPLTFRNCHYIRTFSRDRRGVAYTDRLCAFRCVAFQLGHRNDALDSATRELADNFSKHYHVPVSDGIRLDQLDQLEVYFHMAISVYEHDGSEAKLVRRPKEPVREAKLYLYLVSNHFCLITDIEKFTRNFHCVDCGRIFRSVKVRHRHVCKQGVAEVFPGGVFALKPTVFDRLDQIGIWVDEKRRFYPFRAVFDFESMLDPTDIPNDTAKITWKARHIPISCAVVSNVPEFGQPEFFLSNGDPDELVDRILAYLHRVQEAAHAKLSVIYRDVLAQLDVKLIQAAHLDKKSKTRIPPLELLTKQFYRYLNQLPVLGFNSGKYDLNLIKPYLLKRVMNDDLNVIKRGNVFMSLSTSRLRFLDLSLYLAPGFSLDQFLRAYQTTVFKGKFPYEFLDSYEKLDYDRLPSKEAFYNALKNTEISDTDYAECQRIWREEGMVKLSDYLKFYNIRDVVPFLEAIEKQFDFYKTLQCDMFKDAVSIPGLCARYLFLHSNTNFVLFDDKTADIHRLMQKNLIGGPSIIFLRFAKIGETKIRPETFGDQAKTVREIVGYDANSLYLDCLSLDMPNGYPVLWSPNQDFTCFTRKATEPKFGRSAAEWLSWMAHKHSLQISHQFNKGEVPIGNRKIKVDGFAISEGRGIVFQYFGCYFHGCPKHHPDRVKYDKTADITRYLETLGFQTVTIFECEWHEARKTMDCTRFRRSLRYRYIKEKTLSHDRLIGKLLDGTFFGVILVDIHTPDHLRHRFREMTPIFKHARISRADIGPHMQQYAEDRNIMSQPRNALIGSYFGGEILLSSRLAKWYLEHGLVISKIHRAVEYEPVKCFEKFAEEVSHARRQGDADPNKAILAQTFKLLGNSGYGKTLENPFKYERIKYVRDEGLEPLVEDPLFKGFSEVDDALFEVSLLPKKIVWSNCIHIGFMVYSYAKLRMLQFYFDCVLYFIDERDFVMLEMDTDSLYMALSGDFESLIKEELKDEFYRDYNTWFPAVSCDQHLPEFIRDRNRFDRSRPCCREKHRFELRTRGLFKIEYATASEGSAFAGLSSKTYFCHGEHSKIACKGLQKSNPLTLEQFHDVLKSQKPSGGVNKGFLCKNGSVFTYEQYRDALSYFYVKRIVCEDGVTTLPLDV